MAATNVDLIQPIIMAATSERNTNAIALSQDDGIPNTKAQSAGVAGQLESTIEIKSTIENSRSTARTFAIMAGLYVSNSGLEIQTRIKSHINSSQTSSYASTEQ